jgi:hypothetical protein
VLPAFKPLPKAFLSIAFSLLLAPDFALRLFAAWRRRKSNEGTHGVVKLDWMGKLNWSGSRHRSNDSIRLRRFNRLHLSVSVFSVSDAIDSNEA